MHSAHQGLGLMLVWAVWQLVQNIKARVWVRSPCAWLVRGSTDTGTQCTIYTVHGTHKYAIRGNGC